MAISKKGLRKIVVEEKVFYWKFNKKIFIYSNEIKNSLLIVDFGWYDVWLFINDKENRPPDFAPQVATPKFVSESIIFALNNQWKNGKLEIEYKNNMYKS